jgi:hypothetical protein
MKTIIITLLSTITIFSQSFISAGMTSAKLISDADISGVKSETGLRFGIKFFSSESFLVDIEYISFKISTSDYDYWEEESYSQEDSHNYLAFSPKIKVSINEKVYIGIGGIAAFHIGSKATVSSDYGSDSGEIENMKPFLILGSAELGIHITEKFLLIGYYDHGFSNIFEAPENVNYEIPDVSLGAIGAKIALSL